MTRLQSYLAALVVASLLLLGLISPAEASTVTFSYATVISGDTPSGPSPWVSAIFDDGGGTGSVTLTMSASGLTGSENISGMYFNIDPSFNPASLNFTYLGTTGPAATSVQTGNDSFKADGDGYYDILFNFPTGGGFNANETVKYLITGIPGLTAGSFNYLSACGNPPCSGPGNYYAAAHIQNTTGSTGGSWVASNVGVVPIPASLWLLGSGLFALVGVGRRRDSAGQFARRGLA